MLAVEIAEMNREQESPPALPEENWKRFCESLDGLNEFSRPWVLRRYQSDILNGGGFRVVSPRTGNAVAVTRCATIAGHIAYWIADSAAWLVAGYVGLGYPIHSLVTTGPASDKFLLIRDNKPLRQAKSDAFRSLANVQLDGAGGLTHKRVTLLIGHENFAHHLRNELSALDEWLRCADPSRLKSLLISATDEPLGPLRELFPQLASCEIARGEGTEPQEVAIDVPIAVRVGSQLVTERVRRRVREFAARNAKADSDPQARSLLAGAWPRIWISCRVGWRAAVNFDGFFVAVVAKLFSAYPRAAILLDGFSFPYMFFEDARTAQRRESFVARAQETEAAISKLIAGTRERLGTAVTGRILSVSGIDLLTAIALAGSCDYYICHFGTLQHKIGWIHDIHGIQHGPVSTASTKDFSERWHRSQVEEGIPPDAVPASLITIRSTPGRRSWNRDYEFSDVEGAADVVLGSMRNRIRGD